MSERAPVHENCDCSLRCKLHYWRTSGSMQIDSRATPTRRNTNPPPTANPAWEAGVPVQARPGGGAMPVIDGRTMHAVHLKEYGERRTEIEAGLRQNHLHHQPVT